MTFVRMMVVPAPRPGRLRRTAAPRALPTRLAALVAVAALALTGCSSDSGGPEAPGGTAGAEAGSTDTPEQDLVADGAVQQSDAPALADAPELGACRVLVPQDVAQASNDSDTVDCGEQHTAQTFVVGSFPENLTRGTAWKSPKLGGYIYGECTDRFGKFVGGDDSIVMRSLVSWAWFRPTQEQWADGARWFRCDIVGGSPVADSYGALPTNAKGLFSRGPVEKWMQCVKGASITAGPAIPYTQPHDWRAVSTVPVGTKKDKYPGDEVVASRSQSKCSGSVEAMIGYPEKFEFAYSWFHEAEWRTGNRLSVCWAKTTA